MDIDSTKLTVFFEAPFWIGVFERIERRKLSQRRTPAVCGEEKALLRKCNNPL